MAYVQAFSATFGDSQQPLYLDLINSFSFTAVSIGTGPDCITPQALDFLEKLNQKIEVWVELGVQTIHDKTLERINEVMIGNQVLMPLKNSILSIFQLLYTQSLVYQEKLKMII